MSEEEQDRDGEKDRRDGAATEAGFCGLEAAGCCLVQALTVFALFFSVSTLLLVNR